jgi:hypothetical protein
MEAAVVSYDWRIAGEMAVRTARARHHRRNGFEWARRFITLIGGNDAWTARARNHHDDRSNGKDGLHRRSPAQVRAARCTARRIRRYVPHRQMFPAIASSMSVSVGRAIARNNTTADIICPD